MEFQEFFFWDLLTFSAWKGGGSGASKSMKNAKDEIASDDRNDKMGHNTATL